MAFTAPLKPGSGVLTLGGMRCALCGSEMAYVHGHAACIESRCPLYGRNQAECCDGETAANCPTTTADLSGPRSLRIPHHPKR